MSVCRAPRCVRRWAAVPTLLALLTLPALLGPLPAQALRLLDQEEHTLDLDGAFKSFFIGLYLPRHPPELLALLGATDNYGGLGVSDVRLRLEGAHDERWKWQLHFRSQAQVSSIPNALSVLGTGGFARPPRWLPLQTTTPDSARFQWNHELDRLSASVRLGAAELVVGRQAISFGAGFLWQPADLVATFSPLELDREYKPGVDALRLNLALGAFTELALVFAAGGPACRSGRLPDGSSCSDADARFSLQHSVALARLRTTVGPVDVGGLAGWVRGDFVAGAFASAVLGRTGLRAEAVLTHDLEEDLTFAGSGNAAHRTATFVRATLGVDYRLDTRAPVVLFGEVYYNGFGSRSADDYAALARRPRMAEFAEVLNVGLLYLGGGATYEPHPRVRLSLVLMSNLFDPSLHLAATGRFKVSDEQVVEAGAFVPLGRPMGSDLVVRSEYGLYPNVYYLAWKAYF